jgi:hypothetical protein
MRTVGLVLLGVILAGLGKVLRDAWRTASPPPPPPAPETCWAHRAGCDVIRCRDVTHQCTRLASSSRHRIGLCEAHFDELSQFGTR